MPGFSFSVHSTKQECTGMSLIMMMFGHKPMMSFEMVDMVDLSTEGLIEQIGESGLEAAHAISVFRDHINDKAVNNIQWAEV